MTRLPSGIANLEDLFLYGLRDVIYAENRILGAISNMIECATNRDLKATLLMHAAGSKKQIKRLALVFERLGKSFEPIDGSPAIDGLVAEAECIGDEIHDRSVIDAAIVGTARAIKHHEIARYTTLIAWARDLGHTEIVRLLATNLSESKAINGKLNTLSLHDVDLQVAS